MPNNRQVQRAVFIIFRAMAQAASNQTDIYSLDVANILRRMTSPTEQELMRRLIKSVILLTAGNQEVLRNPELFADKPGTKTYRDMASTHLMSAHVVGLNLNAKPTKEDYIDAKKLLPIFSTMSVGPEEFDQFIASRPETRLDAPLTSGQYGDTVWRGVHNMRLEAAKYLVNKDQWDITRSVSTSYDRRTSYNFSNRKVPVSSPNYKGPVGILLEIDVGSRGLKVGSLSYYGEDEVILSGYLTIDSVEMEYVAAGSNSPQKETNLEKINQLLDMAIEDRDAGLDYRDQRVKGEGMRFDIKATHVQMETPDEV